jgi:hypothetical protein
MKPRDFARAVRYARNNNVAVPRWMALARQLAADIVTERCTYANALERLIAEKVGHPFLSSMYTELRLELRRLGGNPK